MKSTPFLQKEKSSKKVKIKICGITNLEDAKLACDLGADALGFIFFPPSPRNIEKETVKDIISKISSKVTPVGVFVDLELEDILETVKSTGIKAVQLHGGESPEIIGKLPVPTIKGVRVKSREYLESVIKDYQPAAFLLDTFKKGIHGGTGETFNWDVTKDLNLSVPLILAGGLNPDNIRDAIDSVKPFAVDISSGVEATPGKKCPTKLKSLFKACSKIS